MMDILSEPKQIPSDRKVNTLQNKEQNNIFIAHCSKCFSKKYLPGVECPNNDIICDNCGGNHNPLACLKCERCQCSHVFNSSRCDISDEYIAR